MGHSTTEVTEMYAHLCADDPDINLMTGDDDQQALPRQTHLRIVK